MAVESSLVPSAIRRAAEVIDDVMATANHLASFYGEIDLTRTRVPKDEIELGADRVFQQLRERIARAVRPRCAAFRRYLGVDNVRYRFVRRIGTHVHHRII